MFEGNATRRRSVNRRPTKWKRPRNTMNKVEESGVGRIRRIPQKTEEELAKPAMQVFQRFFTTNAGAPTTEPESNPKTFGEENTKYLERPSNDKASNAKMLYVNADGHHHWHLQHVAKYSLWNSEKTAEVAPAEKVGFCLEDSEQIEEELHDEKGPAYPVYSDSSPPGRDFCQRFSPNATSVYEGISPGWRDAYTSNLGFQWVDTSNVHSRRILVARGSQPRKDDRRKKVSGARWPTRKSRRSFPASTPRRKRPAPTSVNRSP